MDGDETDVDYSVEQEEHINVLTQRVNELYDPVNHAKRSLVETQSTM